MGSFWRCANRSMSRHLAILLASIVLCAPSSALSKDHYLSGDKPPAKAKKFGHEVVVLYEKRTVGFREDEVVRLLKAADKAGVSLDPEEVRRALSMFGDQSIPGSLVRLASIEKIMRVTGISSDGKKVRYTHRK